MSARKDVVSRFVEGFRTSDHEAILSTLHDNVVWTLHGYKTLVGKDKFDSEIEHPEAPGHPQVSVESLVEEGDTVVAMGRGEVSLREGGGLSFVFCDVYVFDGDLIKELQSYQVNLNNPGSVL